MIQQAELVQTEERNPPVRGDPALQRSAEVSPRVVIVRLRPEEKRLRAELGAQVRSELAFRHRSSAEASGVTRSYTYDESGRLVERPAP